MSNHTYEFARDFLRQVGYVGSKTTHLTGCLDFSQALVATPRHPVTGQTTTTVGNLAQRVPFVGIAGGSYICTTKFDANYNSLQTGVTKRFSHGLDFQASYTFSKNLDFTSGTGGLSSLDLAFLSNDQTNPRQARGLDDFDRRHRLVLSLLYEAPKLAMGSTPVRHVLSQWQFSGIAVLQAGLPITVTDDRAGSVYGNLPGFVRAECTGANPASSGSIFSRLNGYFNPAAFTTPPVIGSDGLAGDPNALGGFDQVRRRIKPGANARGPQSGFNHRAGGTLPVGSRDVNEAAGTMRVAECAEQPRDPF